MSFLSKNLTLMLIYVATTIYVVLSHAPSLLISFVLSILMMSAFIWALNSISTTFAKITLFLYSICFFIQVFTIALTGNYIDEVALSNIYEYSSISKSVRVPVFIAFFVCLSGILLFKFSPNKHKRCAFVLMFFGGLLVYLVPYELPAISFIKKTYSTAAKYNKYRASNTHIKEEQKKIYGKNYVVPEDQYKFENVPNLQNKNIVLFFTEALSAQKVDLFNDYEGLTPNLSEFIKKSFYFDNYYNHTFTTFRGIRGQLSSSYQYTGVVKAERISSRSIRKKFFSEIITLPQILSQNGYNTYFLSARSDTVTNLNFMIRTLGFDYVFTPKYFNFDRDLSDQQLFLELTKLITEGKLKEPYFIAVYNIGTHFGQILSPVQYKDGDNSLLNNIHNFDDAFGHFFNKISSSDIINNLAIVLTADHSAFADKQYCDTFGEHKPTWVNKVPFAIYATDVSPQIIDAKGKNSVDFAPTLLHMMHINNAENYFLGCSLFQLECTYPFEHYTVGGDIFYKTTPEQIVILSESDAKADDTIKIIEDYYHLSESLFFGEK